jgi:hypothetical protein
MISNHFFRTTKGEQNMKKISGVLCLALTAALLLIGGAPSYAADGGKVSQIGKLTVYSYDSKAGDATIDYDRALPMPLPQTTIRPSGVAAPARTVHSNGAPGFQPVSGEVSSPRHRNRFSGACGSQGVIELSRPHGLRQRKYSLQPPAAWIGGRTTPFPKTTPTGRRESSISTSVQTLMFAALP